MVGCYHLFSGNCLLATHYVRKEDSMRAYEVACVFQGDDVAFTRGRETVKSELAKLGAQIVGEEDLGQRNLAYPIKKETRGHYWIYSVQMDPIKAKQIEHALRLTSELLRVLVIKKDGK